MVYFFLKLFNMSIAAGWLILAVFLLRLFLRKAPRSLHCILWALVGIRLLCPFSLESAFSLIPSAETVRPEMLYSDSIGSDNLLSTGGAERGNSVTDAAVSSLAPAAGDSVNPLQVILFVAAVLWLAGLLIFALYAVISGLRLWRRVREGVRWREETERQTEIPLQAEAPRQEEDPPQDEALQQENVWLCDQVDTPFIFGIFRPRIILPASISQEAAAYVLAHEKTHIRRHDHWWKPLSFLLLSIYWFHPLVWAAYLLFGRDLELACDEGVIRGFDAQEKKAYSEALLACSVNRQRLVPTPLAFGEIGVKDRIRHVLNYRKPTFWIVLVALLCCGIVSVCFLTDPKDPVAAEKTKNVEEAKDAQEAKDASKEGTSGEGTVTREASDKAGEGYTDEELIRMAGEYYLGHSETGFVPSVIEIDSETEDGEVRLHLYERVDEGKPEAHTATYAWYVVDRVTAKGYEGITFEEIDLTDPEGTKAVSQGQKSAEDANFDRKKARQALEKWAYAFVDRDGNEIAALSSGELADQFRQTDLLMGSEGQYSFGVSSPWPWDRSLDAVIYDYDGKQAVIYYYAWTSDPHITVWRQELSYEWEDDGYVFTQAELQYYDAIAWGEEFEKAYPGGTINGTRMDYLSNEAGKTLNDNALSAPKGSGIYEKLLEPESAAVALLNLLDNPNKVRVERLKENLAEGGVLLQITFLEDNVSVKLRMAQPYGTPGIWIPQNYEPDPLLRFMKVPWDEVEARKLSLDSEPDWQDIVCIGELPQQQLIMYGYNDEECSGRGVAIYMKGDTNYFDWEYMTPRLLYPVLYWDEEQRRLEVALNIYTGTGMAAQQLHVLRYYDTGTLQGNAFSLEDYGGLLAGRIGCEQEASGRLLLKDLRSGGTLVEVDPEEMSLSGEKVTGLELGNMSEFVLGPRIYLKVTPGWIVEDSVMAQYEGMPTLEAEVLITEEEGGLYYDLGEIKVSDRKR